MGAKGIAIAAEMVENIRLESAGATILEEGDEDLIEAGGENIV